MPILRLAYTTQFLVALVAIFVLWSQVGGQSHLDLLPWSLKLVLGLAAAYGTVRATAASVSGEQAWNSHALRWLAFTLALLAACGYATYYAHMNLEDVDDEQQQDTTISSSWRANPYNSVRLESARRLARSAPTSVTTMRSPS